MTYVVVVTGPPAGGKTTLGRQLAADLGVPFVSKDAIKESLYDSLGWTAKAGSRRLGIASFEVLYVVLEALVAAGVSVVIEAPFDPEMAAAELESLRQRYPLAIVQVLCRAEGRVLIERYRARNDSGERHPGHIQTDLMAEVEEHLAQGTWTPVAIESGVIEVDTSDPATLNYDTVLEDVSRAIGSS